MDPLHITEFASNRYFEKLAQLRDASASQQGHAVEGPSSPPQPLPQSEFILPLRGSRTEEEERFVKPVDQKRHDKSRFLSFRSKILPSRASSVSSTEHIERRPSIAESTKQGLPFDELFLHLPNELQVQIIASLPLSDILNLRLASRSLHALVSLNEAPIVRYHLDHHIPAYAKRLYPIPQDTPLNFHYLCGIWHRLHVAAKLSYLMCEWITKEIFLRTTEEKRQVFAPQRERMRRRLIPLLFTVFHFFETYRDLHLKYIEEHGGYGLSKEPYTINPVEARIMNMYDDQTLLRVHQIFPLVISSFCRRLRPPSYVGRVEGALRGYLREKPPDEVHVAILCIGGLRQVERFWEVKGYNLRRAAVDAWYSSLVEPEVKKRRGLIGLGRKKSSATIGKQAAQDGMHSNRSSMDAGSLNRDAQSGNSLIFNTSLAAGMPMPALGKDHLRLLLADLPRLQQIWLTTAEAIILDRKIVERPTDIKRNAQVMLDLIREDGLDAEDEWWYGTSTAESVRPNLEAIEEDAFE
ncbi:hypothetical protein VTK73DRAFT_7640 [Phialemonium thermophilum]|uniref:F-box domain-containing protein n=1 Tax=Phialemonium thermophilum TaxID=223376 RepID=A0ABR3Y7N8_9PEZI